MSWEEISNRRKSESAPRIVKLPRHRLRSLASTFLSLHRPPPPPPLPPHPLTVVCISDTHGTRPPIPPGDLLLHAGDLSKWGTFVEIQAQLTWLSHQPHKYKVIIAGNHDLLLDPKFKEQYPQRWKQAAQAASDDPHIDYLDYPATDLEWGGIIYLYNTSVLLEFPNSRILRIYGSPLTPRYGISAFQYPASDDVWAGRIPRNTDIILTHGPPRGHLDGPKKSGCAFLTKEVVKVRPRLVVYGHIHVGYGIEERVYDRVGKAHERISGLVGGWGCLVEVAWGVVWGYLIPRSWRRRERRTIFVNAAVVEGWENHVVRNEAVVLRI